MKTYITVLILAGVFLTQATASVIQKTPITSADQLPRRSYQLKGTATALLDDRPQLRQHARELLGNLQEDLDRFDIQDSATLSGYYATMLTAHVHLEQYDEALALVPLMRKLETKPAARLTTGLFIEAWIRARQQVPDTSSEAFRKAFETLYAQAYAPLPYTEIREQVDATKAQLSLANREVVLGSVESQLQPILEKTGGTVPEGIVASLLNIRFMLDVRMPLQAEMLTVLNDLTEKNRHAEARADIWGEREVTLAPADVRQPVVVAIWDSGVDMEALPAANRFVNPKEKADGRDTDGNGFVDDVHGIAYDMASAKKSVGTLDDPSGKITSDVRRLQRLVKGSIDLQAGLHTAEAAELQKTMAALKRDEVKAFTEELSFYTGYFHGTHVAGIALAGNPGVRILGARMTHSHESLPRPHTMERAQFTARMYRDTVEYFKKQGVRVVNMSWRYSGAAIEASLTVNGVGRDEKERRQMARQMFEIEKAALLEAIRSAPGILFVCGSGNESNDADFSEYIPASLDLPNLLTIGAVDSAGRKAAFTTEGRSVDFYANGHEVESYVPGGDRILMSGTSMASPQVTNLAAKLLALDPSLTPTDLVTLIGRGAEPSSEDPKIRLVNPKRTLEMVRR